MSADPGSRQSKRGGLSFAGRRMSAAAFAVLLFQGGREVGQESRKRLFQPICICLAAINTDAFPAYREKAPRWASAWQAAQFFNP